MGSPVQLLGQARAFARDFPRDEMPKGYLWDVVNFVPSLIDTNLTGRGAWDWSGSVTGHGDIEVGIFATFKDGKEWVMGRAVDGSILRYDGNNGAWGQMAGAATGPFSRQNPVQLAEDVIHFDSSGGQVPQLWHNDGSVVPMNALHKHAVVGTTWQGSLITGGAPGEEDMVRFTSAGQDLTAAASYDDNAFMHTGLRVTALQGMRTMCLVFHPSSIQRIRGGPFPSSNAGKPSGLVLDQISDRIGCQMPLSIATWQDQCIFANSRGVFITDGTAIRNLTSMGGISYYWRLAFDGHNGISATTFLDYYIICIRHDSTRPPPPLDGLPNDPDSGIIEALPELPPEIAALVDPRPPVPPIPPDLPPIRPPVPSYPTGSDYNTVLVCDLNRKQWFRWTNFPCVTLISGAGATAMERAWGSLKGYSRMARVGPMFYPGNVGTQVDGNAIAVNCRIETPWYRLSTEGRKRVRFAYVTYDVQGPNAPTDPVRVGYCITPTISSTYQQAATLPFTTGYTRLRVPVYKFPYGISFYVETIQPTQTLRLYDLGVEFQAAERSRV